MQIPIQRTFYKNYDYTPYGKILWQDNNNDERHSFLGKEKDEESDLGDYGVRKYDDLTGRFTATDPLWEKYYGWSPYVYSGNDPVNKVDLDGRKIRYSEGVSDDFKRNFALTIQYLNKNKISGVIKQLEDLDDIIYVKESFDLKEFSFNPNDNTIYYNPHSALEVDTGTQSPAMGFLHEGAHALNWLLDPTQFKKDIKPDGSEYQRPEERKVIEGIETPAAQKAGEGTRKNHYGKEFEVKDPTKREKK